MPCLVGKVIKEPFMLTAQGRECSEFMRISSSWAECNKAQGAHRSGHVCVCAHMQVSLHVGVVYVCVQVRVSVEGTGVDTIIELSL